MKRVLLSLSAILLCAAVLTGCEPNTPKDVAEKFLTAMNHLDYTAAKKYATEETKQALEQQEVTEKQDTANAASTKAEAMKIKVNVKEPVLTNDSMATVEYTLSNAPTSTKKLKLVKRGGKWLAQWSKMGDIIDAFGGDMNNGNGMPMTPDPGTTLEGIGTAVDTPLAPEVEEGAKEARKELDSAMQSTGQTR